MIVYKITNILNNKIYIGQDKNHNPNYFGSGDLIKRAIKKYGKENFKKEILTICNNMNELNEMERYYINEYKSTNRNIGYNISVGGTDGVMLNRQHSDETKMKMRLSALNRFPSEETKEKMSRSHMGKHRSEETKNKIRTSHKLLKHSPLSEDTKRKIRDAKKGKFASKETKEKMRLSHMGEKNHFYGKNHSDEYLLRKRKPIIQLDINDNFINEWSSITEAANYLKIECSGISYVLSGKYKTSGGFKFKFKNNE